MTIAIISHPDCVLHEGGDLHPEQPARVTVIQAALEQYQFDTPVTFHLAPLVTREQLISVHDAEYIDWIMAHSPKDGYLQIDADTAMNPQTLAAAKRAAGSVIFAVDLIMRDEASVAFCNVRPPGHHAERGQAMGFCFFNNIAVGVKHVMTQYSLKRIAIIDFDVHHGNGTQDIFQNDRNVLYCSSFEHPFYPGYESGMDNEHILSVPLQAGTDGNSFREKVKAAWFEKINAFQPEFIFISAGFDAHINDPLADLRLTDEDYVWITKQIAEIAKKHSQGRIVSVLEGGYHLQALAQCVPQHVNHLIALNK